MGLAAAVRLSVPTAADMRALGHDLARLSRPGDLIVLIGELGAGKTQLAQGIGQGLNVAGAVISPSFVLSRHHRPHGDGPGLVHVDAYRLTSREEIDDLDLEPEMANAVTVVEWGDGLAEQLGDDRLEVTIERSPRLDDETRQVSVTPIGARWANLIADWERIVNEDMGRDARSDRLGVADD